MAEPRLIHRHPSPPSRLLLHGLGILWASPNTLLGLVAGAAGLCFGAHAHWRPRDLALVFHRWPWGPGAR